MAIVIASTLLGIGSMNPKIEDRSLRGLYSLGFGTVTPNSFISPIKFNGPWGLILTILISNCPQIILSFVYLSYNNILTSFHLVQEWNGYASHRKALRVTTPTGKQRGTYWLQLPYRYSIPFLLASAILHWLASQSIFLARVTVLNSSGVVVPDESISTCGYSNIAILLFIVLAPLLVLIVLLLGLRRYTAMMPLARSCSAAISAACHPSELDTDAAFKPVKWGVIEGREISSDGKEIRHCAFTSFKVGKPEEGKFYT